MPPRKAWPSITKATLWVTRYVLNSHTVEAGLQNFRESLGPASNAGRWVIGLGASSNSLVPVSLLIPSAPESVQIMSSQCTFRRVASICPNLIPFTVDTVNRKVLSWIACPTHTGTSLRHHPIGTIRLIVTIIVLPLPHMLEILAMATIIRHHRLQAETNVNTGPEISVLYLLLGIIETILLGDHLRALLVTGTITDAITERRPRRHPASTVVQATLLMLTILVLDTHSRETLTTRVVVTIKDLDCLHRMIVTRRIHLPLPAAVELGRHHEGGMIFPQGFCFSVPHMIPDY